MGEHRAAPGADASGNDARGNAASENAGNAVPGGTAQARAQHTPVFLDRTLELLAPALTRPEAVHIDATLGLGGHAEAVLQANAGVRLIGFDRDPRALQHSRERLAPYANRVIFVHAVYDRIGEVLHQQEVDTVDSVLFDLGVSSMQLDEAERGFAYSHDAPLDMRMDPTTGITAEEVVNDYAPGDLVRILRAYGEERFAQRIVAAIVRERGKARITGTARLSEIVRDAIPAATRRTGGHPAKRSFQALRIEVNAELSTLEAALPQALDALAVGGRIVVLAYHSLEDRIVKRAFAERATSHSPIDLPIELPGSGPTLRLLTRGAELAGEAETTTNPRATSVRLRAAERIDPDRRPVPGMHQPATRGRPDRPSATPRQAIRSSRGDAANDHTTDTKGDGR